MTDACSGINLGLSIIIVDNASDRPITPDDPDLHALPDTIPIEILRLNTNTGGSGGYNAGMQRAIESIFGSTSVSASLPTVHHTFIWLLDSDARVLPETLIELVRTMLRRPDAAAVGSAIADPVTHHVFEVGGRVDRRDGRFQTVLRGTAGAPVEVECEYAAACSLLVRPAAIIRTGLMPDVFLNADDVEWCIRMRRATGQRILCCTRSIAFHPRFDRFAQGARYYVARNSLNPLRVLSLSLGVRVRRATHEVARAVGCELMGRPDLARLHILGLRDAGAHARCLGPADPSILELKRFVPLDHLARHVVEHGVVGAAAPAGNAPIAAHAGLLRSLGVGDLDTLSDQVRAIAASSARWSSPVDILEPRGSRVASMRDCFLRLLGIRRPHVALVQARPVPESVFAGRWVIQVAPGVLPGGRAGFVLVASGLTDRLRSIARAGLSLCRGTAHAIRAASLPDPLIGLQLVGTPLPHHYPQLYASIGLPPRLSLSIIVLSYNRREMLCSTLARLSAMPDLDHAQIIVVDNASTDGSADAAKAASPRARVITLEANTGVAALNTGVAAADGDAVLVLDDDAWPADGVLSAALSLLSHRADIDAVALHPHHPSTGRSEWPFAASAHTRHACTDRWPVMGCGNLVRRSVWEAVGGYEADYFLYRNDVDLALKVLSQTGHHTVHDDPGRETASSTPRGVFFNPAWIVWHDSPAAATKSDRWHYLATRNWIWTARRHGRGLGGFAGLLLGWAWAHRLAGLSIQKHWHTLRGASAGCVCSPPTLPPNCQSTGRHFSTLVRLHLSRVFGRWY